MHHIKAKISDLQLQYDALLKQRQQDIAHLITTLDLTSLEDPILVGGLLYIRDKTVAQDAIMEVWRNAGERFLRRPKSQKSRLSQQTETAAPKTQSPQKSS
jgi:hypothetical protein